MWIDEIELQQLVTVYGKLKPIKGLSLGCMLDFELSQSQLIKKILTHVEDQEIFEQFSICDHEKLHVCMMPLLCNEYRVPESWSIHIPLDVSYNEIKSTLNSYFEESFSEQPYRLKFKEVCIIANKLSISIEAADVETMHTLEAMQDFVSKTLGLRMFALNHFDMRIHLGIWNFAPLNDLTNEITDFILQITEETKEDFGLLKLDGAKILEHSSLLDVEEIISPQGSFDR
tara:strand:+ start:345 stop:1034 length:690 start_codon:yes stop_codon:yes gene_type:complete